MEFIVNVITVLIGLVGSILTWIIVGSLICAILFGIKYLIWKENPPLIIHKLRWVIAVSIGILMFWLQDRAGIDFNDGKIQVFFVVWMLGKLILNDEPEK